MGYLESAPLFCSTTELIADFANNDTPHTHPHPLDALASTNPTPPDPAATGFLTTEQETRLAQHLAALPPGWQQQCLNYTDVYVDDFILLQQGSQIQRIAARRNLFHHIDRVFRPNDVHDKHGAK